MKNFNRSRIGSVSKMITAFGVMKSVEEKKLNKRLTDKILCEGYFKRSRLQGCNKKRHRPFQKN